MNQRLKIKKIISYPASIISLISSGYLYFSPYISILGFKSAVESKDTEEARQYIDFPSVRRSLKDQLREALTKKIATRIAEEPFGPIKMILISPMVGRVVSSTIDATVTPNGLKILLSQGTFSSKDSNGVQKSGYNSNKGNKVRISLYYKGLNRFILRSDIPNISEPMKAYWKRDMLWKWKLSSIELPYELMNELN